MIINMFFTLLNFGVFLGFVIYYFRKSIIGLIKNELLLKEAECRDLHNQSAAANIEYRSLQERSEYQKTLYASLDRKIMMWRTAVQAGERETERERNLYESNIRERLQKQRDYVHALEIVNHVVPVAFDESAKRLSVYFSDPAHCREYNRQVCERLKKQ